MKVFGSSVIGVEIIKNFVAVNDTGKFAILQRSAMQKGSESNLPPGVDWGTAKREIDL